MEIQFASPEEHIVNQGDDLTVNDNFYLIERGECVVSVKDK